MEIIANILGVIGVLLLLLAYFYIQLGKIQALSFTYPLLNLLGSLLIFFSLLYDWNFPAALIETAWAIVSIFGIWKWFHRKKKGSTT